MTSPIDIVPTARTGPVCACCGDPALVSWQRRLTDAELADHHALLNAQHAERLRLHAERHPRLPKLPPPVQPPLPPADGCTRIVHACYDHAITLDAAAHIHQSGCTAPNEADLPGCDCTPEPLPPQTPLHEPPVLPPGWGNGAG